MLDGSAARRHAAPVLHSLNSSSRICGYRKFQPGEDGYAIPSRIGLRERRAIYNITDQFTHAIPLSMSLTETYTSGNVITGSGIGAQISDCFIYCSSKCRQG